MNTRPILDSSSGPFALGASFNADNSCFSVALENGFRVFSSKSGAPKLARDVGGAIGCAEMLGTTRYLALVGGGKQPKYPQNKVQIWDDAKQVVVTSLEFNAPIQRVRISQTHLVVVLLNNVSIYAMKIPPKKVASYETVNNPFGLCCLSKGLVAFPGITEGQVKLFHLKTKTLSIIPAHNSSLRALGLSQNEDMVATASKQGTIIRLWAVPSCTKITEFRRGVDTAIILSLAFSGSGRLLAATSDKSTLHIFDVPYASESETSPQTHKWGLLSKVPMLPRQFSDTYALMSIKFELGDDPVGDATSRSGSLNAIIPGIPGGRPTKGLAGWINDDTLILIGAGQDARWEKFIIGVDEEGRRVIGREGWKKYLE